ADVVVAGHDHDYERFAPQTADGQPDPQRGLREFVAGTGGRSHYQLRALTPNSDVFNNSTFGVLTLTLHNTGYDSRFVPAAGSASACTRRTRWEPRTRRPRARRP